MARINSRIGKRRQEVAAEVADLAALLVAGEE